MYFRRKKNGKWLFEINKKGYPRLSKGFDDLRTGKKWASKIEHEIETGQFEDLTKASKTTMRALLEKYRDEITVDKKGHREESAKINLLIRNDISSHTITSLKAHHLYKFKKESDKVRAPATTNKYLHMLQNVWNTAKKVWGITMPPYNPFELVTMHKVDNARDRVLTTDEYSKLLDACSEGNMPVLRDIVIFAYETGARQGEILKLKRSDVDFDKRLCTFLDTKNGEDRTIPLTDAAIEILKRHRFGDTLFNLLPRRLRKHFTIACRRAAITNFRFHDLRACFCTNALLSGMTIPEVSVLSGHKDWKQLQRYTRIKPKDLSTKVQNIKKSIG
jgi:integrase